MWLCADISREWTSAVGRSRRSISEKDALDIGRIGNFAAVSLDAANRLCKVQYQVAREEADLVDLLTLSLNDLF